MLGIPRPDLRSAALFTVLLLVGVPLRAQGAKPACVTELRSATTAASRAFRATLHAELKPAVAIVRGFARSLRDETASVADAQAMFEALVEFNTAARSAWLAASSAGVGAAFNLLGTCPGSSTPPDFLYGGGGALDELLTALESEYARVHAKLRRELDRVVDLSAESDTLRLTARLDSPMVPGEIEHAYEAGSYILSVGPFVPVIDVALGVTDFGAVGGTQRLLFVSGSSHAPEVQLAFGFEQLAVELVEQRFVGSMVVSGGLPENGVGLLLALAGEPPAVVSATVAIGFY